MVHYYDKQSAKVTLSNELIERGWKIYGFKEDQSDMMTDYYSPASWDGIAEKNGFVLVIDQHSTHYSGYEVRKYDYSKTRSNSSKVEKLQATVNDKATTPAEKEAAQQLIDKLNAKGTNPTYEVLEVYPTFTHKTPKSCIWHIEKDGQIIAKGKGLYSLYSINDREGTKQNMKQFADKLEMHVNADTQLVPVQKEIKTKVTKVVESDSKELEIGKTLLKLNCGFTGGHSKGNVFVLSSEYNWKAGKTVTLVRLGKKYQVLKDTEKNCLTLKYDNLVKWIEDGSISIVELKEVEEIEVKTVYVKAKRQQKAASTDVQLETSVIFENKEETTPETIEEVSNEVVEAASNVTYKLNNEKNGVEIYFDSIPSEEIRNQLKTNGFRWSRYSKCWYAKQSENTLQLAEQLASGKIEEVEQMETSENVIADFLDVSQFEIGKDIEQRLIDNSLINNNRTNRDQTNSLQSTLSQLLEDTKKVVELAPDNYTKNRLIEGFNSFCERYTREMTNYLYQRSINPSWAVTGRGNLDVNRYNKKQDQLHSKLGKILEMLDNQKAILNKYKNRIEREAATKLKNKINTSISSIDDLITFKTEIRSVTIHNCTDTKRAYVSKNYFIMKTWGCFRIFENKTGKEVYNMKTTQNLFDAKKYVTYLESQLLAV